MLPGAGPVFSSRWSVGRQGKPRMPIAKPVLTIGEQKELKSSAPRDRARDQALKKELAGKEKAMRRWRPCWCCEKVTPSARRTRKADTCLTNSA